MDPPMKKKSSISLWGLNGRSPNDSSSQGDTIIFLYKLLSLKILFSLDSFYETIKAKKAKKYKEVEEKIASWFPSFYY